MNNEKPNLALRVFKRTSKHLILLWRRAEVVDPLHETRITYQPIGKNAPTKPVAVDPKFLTFNEPTIENQSEMPGNLSEETVICIVKEKEAGLSPDGVYFVKVKYGPEEESIRLSPAGVFPSHEREDRDKNQHMYIWDDEGQCWRKWSGVKGPRGQWYAGVVVVNDSIRPLVNKDDEEE